jgi:hypothetical protein
MDNGTMLHTFRLKEMFLTFNHRALKIHRNDILDMFYLPKKREFAIWVFKESLVMVIDDIIEKGVQFQFPNTFGDRSWLCMQRIDGDEYVECRKKGAFRDFDPVSTNFCAYRIEYCMEKASGFMVRIPVHLDAKRSRRIAELANARKMKLGKVVAYQDYYDRILERFPKLPKEDMFRIMRYGYFSFRIHMKYGADIMIYDRSFRLQTGYIYKNPIPMMEYVISKMKTKARILYRRYHIIWDGYSYFSLTKPRYDLLKDKIAKKEVVDYGEVMLHKSRDEGFICAYDRAVLLRVKAGDENTRFFSIERLITDKAEVVETFDKWDWSTINYCNRKYQTLHPSTYPIYTLYKNNIKPYLKWLEQKRCSKLTDENGTKNDLSDG